MILKPNVGVPAILPVKSVARLPAMRTLFPKVVVPARQIVKPKR